MNDARDMADVQPAEFRPSDADPERKGFRPSRAQIIATIAALTIGWFMWFIFTAKSVKLEFVPATANSEITGGFALAIGEIHLLRQGEYRIQANSPGYHPLDVTVMVGEQRNQVLTQALVPLPGKIEFSSQPAGAVVSLDGTEIGTTPFAAEIEAGETQFIFTAPRYQDASVTSEIVGRQIEQTVSAALEPNWAVVTIPTTPPGAAIRIDDEESSFVTPGPAEILAGERRLTLKAPGYKAWSDILVIQAGDEFSLEPVQLEKVEGLINVATTPSGAGVTVDGKFVGTSPIDAAITPNKAHTLKIFLVGFAPVTRQVRVGSGEERSINVALEAMVGDINIETQPADVEILVDGEVAGLSDTTLSLSAVPHEIELRKEGYAGYRKSITPQPGFPQQLRVRLLTVAEARLASLKQFRKTAAGQELVLLSPTTIMMGASRREPGRRANEVMRTTNLDRLFYLSKHEVTNAQFKQFAPGHDSGEFQDYKLNQDAQPVTGVTWEEVALYCNWLSARDRLDPFYVVEFGKVIGFDATALGYRMPTEAEWTWAARHVVDEDFLPRFPWGEKLPPPNKHANFADVSAQHLVGRIIFGYNDNHIAAAPVGTFDANDKGIFDLAGNAAEWTHDFYSIPDPDQTIDVFGPAEGEYHVIRGSSWKHGTVTELRWSFRDYGTDGRDDVGFRIARFAE